MLLSIVIPVYKAQCCVDELLQRCKTALAFTQGNYELVLVEDGSPDKSWDIIAGHCKTEKNIIAIKLSRNFGQHHAITAGLDYCNGDWVVIMDCDLQDQPEAIENLYNEAMNGYDIVYARRINRTDSLSKKLSSKFFYSVFSYLTGIKYDDTIANFGIYNKKVIEAIKVMKEPMRAFAPMVRWLGFSNSTVDVQHGISKLGKTTYTLKKLFTLAFDIIISYSDKPLKIITRLGFIISSSAFIAAFVMLIRYLSGAILVSGYTSIIISIWFLGGLIISILGVIGMYISQIFIGIKNRPFYLVDKIIDKNI